MPACAVLALVLAAAPVALPRDGTAPVTGTVQVDADGDAAGGVPERYRLPGRAFDYKLSLRFRLRHAGVDVYDLSFPSPVASGIPENDVVHGEYYVPAAAAGRLPAAIVLDILDGRQVVARGQALWLAQNGAAALVVYMAHYGPRRPPGGRTRLLSANVAQTLDGVRQTVLDCRCAAAWLAARPEVDPGRIGLVGTSLGSLVGGVAAAAEPRVRNVCLLLGGGGLVDAFYDHPLARPYAGLVDVLGGREMMKRAIAPADPLTYAPQLKGKNLLIFAASRDDVVPPAAARALWEATGRQRIVWVDATHVGAAVHALPALREITAHITGK